MCNQRSRCPPASTPASARRRTTCRRRFRPPSPLGIAWRSDTAGRDTSACRSVPSGNRYPTPKCNHRYRRNRLASHSRLLPCRHLRRRQLERRPEQHSRGAPPQSPPAYAASLAGSRSTAAGAACARPSQCGTAPPAQPSLSWTHRAVITTARRACLLRRGDGSPPRTRRMEGHRPMGSRRGLPHWRSRRAECRPSYLGRNRPLTSNHHRN
mmetsp:Transcript_28234/g.81190  ORF Transcript_28234/g.81190 Transcript_28234/m.81190 type:complete len:211 (+) Transcript_28234:87-719(+)